MLNLSSSSIYFSDTTNTEDEKNLQSHMSKNSCINLNHESIPCIQTCWNNINIGDLETIINLLDEDFNISQQNINSQNQPGISIEKKNEKTVEWFLNEETHAGRDFNQLICNTIKKGNEVIVKHVLDYGLQKNLKINMKSCLVVAIDEKHLQIINLLMSLCKKNKCIERSILKHIVLKDGQEYKECVDLMLNRGFSVDCLLNTHDFVFLAVQNGHFIIVEKLLKLKINVNMINKTTKFTLLHFAVLYNHLDIAQLLINYKADVNWIIIKKKWPEQNQQKFGRVTELSGKTALHIAVDNFNWQMTKLLLDNGAKIVDDLNFFNITCNAIRKGFLQIVQLLIDYRVDVNTTDTDGKNFLHFCASCKFQCSNNGCEIAEFLLQKGINVNAETLEKNTPIFNAIIANNTEMITMLLNHNANIHHANIEGDTLLHKALENIVNEEVLNILLHYNARVNVVNKKGFTPLHKACQKGSEMQLRVIEKLLRFEANINCPDRNNRTPLHVACDKGFDSVVRLLLEYGASVNVVDSDGNTPLHLGCKNRNSKIVEDLLKCQADPNIKNNCDQTPLLILSDNLEAWLPKTIERLSQNQGDLSRLKTVIERHHNNLKMTQLLLKYRSDINAVNIKGKSSLHVVVEKNYFTVVKILIKFNIDLNIIDNKGQTALHYAAENGNLSIIKCLLIHGADVNISSNQNRTALHHAFIGMMRKQKIFRTYLKDPREIIDDKPVSANRKDECTEPYQEEINSHKNVIQTLKEHIIKLKCAKLNIDFRNVALAYSNITNLSVSEFDPCKFQNSCEKEIVLLMMTKIDKRNITFYELLTQDVLFLTRYANDKIIMRALLSEANRKMFPLYIDIITLRFMTGAQRYDLIEIAKKYSLPTIFQGLSCNYADKVLSYFDMNELKKFIEIVKRVYRFGRFNPSRISLSN